MIGRGVVVLFMLGAMVSVGCQSTPKRTVLASPDGTDRVASRHNEEGIHAYQEQQWATAKHHFEAAIHTAPSFAEAHYNLGLALYKLGGFKEGDQHFIEAANLSPGNKVLWDAPPLRGVAIPEKEVPGMSSDGHMHSH